MSIFDSHLTRYNFPPYSATQKTIQNIISRAQYGGIIGDSISGEYENIDGILVEKDFIQQGINAEYLNTSIVGRHIFIPTVGCTIGVPCHTPIPFLVLKTEEIPQDKKAYNYKKIITVEEAVIADIYKNAWRYRFDNYLDAYVRLPEQGAKQQLAKHMLAKEIANIAGSPYDRLADYGRIILFLLSKAALTSQEREQLAPLSTYAPTLPEINEVLYREEQIQKKIKNAKENTDAYLGLNS